MEEEMLAAIARGWKRRKRGGPRALMDMPA
jgi:hypothetical protein